MIVSTTVAAFYVGVFGLSAFSKLDSWRAWSTTVTRLELTRFETLARLAIPLAELAVLVLLLVVPSIGLVVATAAMVFFLLASIHLRKHHRGQTCNCFGVTSAGVFDTALIVRNSLLVAPGLTLLLFGLTEDASRLTSPQSGTLILFLLLYVVLAQARVTFRGRLG